MSEKLLVTPEEAAERLSIGRTVMYDLLRRGEIPSVRLGRSRRIPVAALEAYVERLLAEAAPSSGMIGVEVLR